MLPGSPDGWGGGETPPVPVCVALHRSQEGPGRRRLTGLFLITLHVGCSHTSLDLLLFQKLQ